MKHVHSSHKLHKKLQKQKRQSPFYQHLIRLLFVLNNYEKDIKDQDAILQPILHHFFLNLVEQRTNQGENREELQSQIRQFLIANSKLNFHVKVNHQTRYNLSLTYRNGVKVPKVTHVPDCLLPQQAFGLKQPDDKASKLEPIKRSQPDNYIALNQKQHIMKLHTTLVHYEVSDRVESKTFYIQVAYKVDGVKNTSEKEVDLATFYKKGNDVQTMRILERPETLLKFKIHVNLKQDKRQDKKVQENKNETKKVILIPETNSSKSLSKPPLANNKSMKIIRFEDATHQETEEDYGNLDMGREKMKSMKNLSSGLKDADDKNWKNDGEQNSKKIHMLETQVQQKSRQLLKVKTKYSQLESKYKDLGTKFQRLKQKYSSLVVEKQAVNKQPQVTQQNDSNKEKYEKLQKEHKKLKEQQLQLIERLQSKQTQVKTLKTQVKSLQQKNKKNELKIKQLKEESQQFEDLLLEMQSKNQKTGPSLEDSLKPYKERIKLLERQIEDLSEEKNFAEKESRTRQDEIIQLRQKIKSLNDQNLKEAEEISNKDYEIEKLTKKVKDLEAELRNAQVKSNKKTSMGSDQEQEEEESFSKGNNRFKSEKVLGSSGSSLSQLRAENGELKRKLQIAQRNLQNKEALLKKFDSFSKEGRKQIEDELEQVKKQNQKLKQKLQSGSGNRNELGGLQSRMELQKVKKQLEYKTKSEKQLLIDKSQLQGRSKALQEDVVKSKQSIANILNVIHEFGDEGLIEEVNAFLG